MSSVRAGAGAVAARSPAPRHQLPCSREGGTTDPAGRAISIRAACANPARDGPPAPRTAPLPSYPASRIAVTALAATSVPPSSTSIAPSGPSRASPTRPQAATGRSDSIVSPVQLSMAKL